MSGATPTPLPEGAPMRMTDEDLSGVAAIAAKIILRTDGDRDHDNKSNLTVEQALAAADLLTRLTASLSSAERERDEARKNERIAETRREAAEWAVKNTDAMQRALAAESALSLALVERDRARTDALEEAQVEVKMMAASEAGGPGFNDGYAIARRDAIAAIGALRGTAAPTDPIRTPFGLPIFPTTKTKSDCANTLEDAARVVEGASIPLSLSNRIPPDAFRLIVARDEAIAKAIRALTPAPIPIPAQETDR